jgi:hypothetical protein
MGTLLFVCPATGQQASTGIEIDRSSFKSLQRHATELACPRCGKRHVLSRVWAWLDEDFERLLVKAEPGAAATAALSR